MNTTASDKKTLEDVAHAMVAPERGILAADESTGTITKRLASIQVESTEENRRRYRELLFTTPELGRHVSGVILYDETLRQSSGDKTPFPQLLEDQGVLPGIKVDKGAKPLPGFPDETITEGLDGLRDRLEEYRGLGAKFAKWRAVIRIDEGLPTPFAVLANADALARYAALCQEAGIVPIVEPEILMDGTHTVARSEEVHMEVLSTVFKMLIDHRVHLPGIVLKPSMVVSGSEASDRADVGEVAERTVRVLQATVPAAVPGIAFLSGGQTPQEATEHLQAMNALGPHPWELTFSYGRALQEPVLKAWKGEDANLKAAQEALAHRARMNGAAHAGTYAAKMEQAKVTA